MHPKIAQSATAESDDSVSSIKPFLRLSLLAALVPLSACMMADETATTKPSGGFPAAPAVSVQALPVMQWDHRPEARDWTAATLEAVREEGAVLLSDIPDDIAAWCPGFEKANHNQRAAFWSGLFSAVARHESTWNPNAVGGNGKWFGLLQISPATARHHGCEARSGEALKNGEANLECAVQIVADAVERTGVVAADRGGMAADWGPFRNDAKREQIRSWVSKQSYCQG